MWINISTAMLTFKHHLTLNGVYVVFVDQVKYLGAWLHASLKMTMAHRDKRYYFTVRQISSGAPLLSILPQFNTLCFVRIACQCTLANCRYTQSSAVGLRVVCIIACVSCAQPQNAKFIFLLPV